MTFAELRIAALAIIRPVLPDISVNLEVNVWDHVNRGEHRPPRVEFRLFWIGIGSSIEAGTPEALLEKLRTRLTPEAHVEPGGIEDVESVGDAGAVAAAESAVSS